jgi:seryl-tRNA(Sec) selenium transferase
VPNLLKIFARERHLWEQSRELRALRGELETLRAKNERMRLAMRRCVTCDYRIEVENRRAESAAEGAPDRPVQAPSPRS